MPRKQGVLLHEAIALLKRPASMEAALQQMKQRGLMTPSQQQHVRETLEEIIATPVFEGWRNGTMQRLSEREIIITNNELRRPDLVLYNSNETLVIDFKFTNDRSADAKYRRQVNEYVSLLQQTGFFNVSGYLLYAGDEIEVEAVISEQVQL